MVKIIYKKIKTDVLNKIKDKKKHISFTDRKRRYRITVAFYMLSRIIPTYLKTNVLKKMTRLEILNYAIQYFKHLCLFLEQSNKEKR